MLIAEDLILLLTDDESGSRTVGSTEFSYALAGAILLDLSLMGRVDVAERGESVKSGRLVVRDAAPTDDPILDLALERLASREGRKPRDVISVLSKRLSDDLYERLTRRGVLRLQPSKVMGLFPRRRWPSQDVAHEDEVRRQIVQTVISPGVVIEPRIGALTSLLSAIDKLPLVVRPDQVGLSKREIRKRGKDIAAQGWAPKAVRQAVEAVNAAMMAAVMVATTAGTASS